MLYFVGIAISVMIGTLLASGVVVSLTLNKPFMRMYTKRILSNSLEVAKELEKEYEELF